MGQPWVGEIRIFAGTFPPNGWAFCDGQLMPISENDVLFTLIGTTYGGDGQETFAMPDLQGRVPVHMGTDSSGSTWQLGQLAGTESVALTTQQIPAHTHTFFAQEGPATGASPANRAPAEAVKRFYRPPGGETAMVSTSAAGGGQPHDNMAPSACIHYIISLFGIYPSQ